MANGNLPPFQPAAKVKLTALVLISAAVIFGFFTRIISVFEVDSADWKPFVFEAELGENASLWVFPLENFVSTVVEGETAAQRTLYLDSINNYSE